MQQRHKTTTRRTYTIVATVILVLILVGHFIWPTITLDPLTAFVLVALMLLWLGPGLFKSMTLPGVVGIEFQEDKDIRAEAKARVDEVLRETKPSRQIKWDKVAVLFWLGNDLMWIQAILSRDMLSKDALSQQVIQGVENAIHYAEDLGFASDSLAIQELSAAKKTLQMFGRNLSLRRG